MNKVQEQYSKCKMRPRGGVFTINTRYKKQRESRIRSDQGHHAGVFPINNNHHYPRQRADALVLMAETFLKDTKVASSTDDRYQIVRHVDSDVLSQKVFEKPSGEPDCYIDKQVAIPVETARRLSCSCKVITALTRKGESRVIHAMQLGYPRFVYHSFVEKFFADCAKKFAGAEEFAKHIRQGRLVK